MLRFALLLLLLASWDAHPREDSYGLLLLAHMDGTSLDIDSLPTTPLDRLRFLLVQRRSTGAWSNLMQALQEAPNVEGAKESWWIAREAGRCTDRELDCLNGTFDELWADETRVSVSWKVDFADCNERFAREKFPALQAIADRIRAQRHFARQDEPDDDHNLSKLSFVIPKGQLQTASSIQRTPHLPQLTVDADVHAGAVREVVEETDIPASDFAIAPSSVPPITFCRYPPRKVDIFLGFLHATSAVHPSRVLEWRLRPQAETRVCKWFSLTQILEYFQAARVYPQSYTSDVVHALIKRCQWQRPLADMQARERFLRMRLQATQQQTQPQQPPPQQQQEQQQPPPRPMVI